MLLRCLAVLALTLPASALAQSLDAVGEFTVEAGGDEVAVLQFTDGSTQSIRAGQGGTLSGGVLVRPAPGSPLGLRTTVGYKFMLNASSNADTRLTRIPVEAVASYNVTPDVWLGAGYVLHAAIRFSGDGFVPDLDFDAASGATVEVGWRGFSASYTPMSYTDETGETYGASSFGLTARLEVPVR